MRLLLVSIVAAWAAAHPALAAQACDANAPPAPAIDALGPVASGRIASSIEFAAPPDAVPAGAAPSHAAKRGAAWVARLHQAVIGGDGWLESAWLVKRRDCEGYLVEKRARMVIPAAQYTAFAAAVEPFALPPAGALSAEAQLRDELEGGAAGDATLDLRIAAGAWTVARAVRRRSDEGARLLRLFDQLAAGRFERSGPAAGPPVGAGED